MTPKALVTLALTVTLSLSLSGCNKEKDEAKIVLTKANTYFPGSVIYHFDNRVLWIQTQVDGISPDVAKTIFEQAVQKAVSGLPQFGKLRFNVTEEMQVDGRSILIIGFKHGMIVAWDILNGIDATGIPRYEVVQGHRLKLG